MPADSKQQKQKVVVVLLLIGLLIAILTQPTPETQPVDADVQDTVAITPVVNAVSQVEETNVQHHGWVTTTRELSRVSLEEIVGSELFALEAKRDPAEILQEAVKQVPVKAIYGSATGQAAIVGQTIVRGGEALPSGGRVVSVQDNGVEIAP